MLPGTNVFTKKRELHRLVSQAEQVAGCCVVIFSCQSMGICKACLNHAKLLGSTIHLDNELLETCSLSDTTVRIEMITKMFCQSYRGIVAGGEHQAIKQFLSR